VCGLHVHVGVESADRCHERLEAVLPWLPAVLALSANSPLAEGAETGMLSLRAAILAELPRAGAPPFFGSYAGWEAWVERLVELGVLEDETRIWWDVRPHPSLGTLEIRIADQPTSPARTELLVRLVRDLVERAPTAEPDPSGRGDYLHNRWAASRFGLDAELIHPGSRRLVRARALLAELLGSEPPEPEALRQLEVARRDGVGAVAADLAARTVG
jgi:carboxylate-amine ligase